MTIKHPYDQHDWRKESLTCDLDELEHVLQAHIENGVAIEAVLRLPPQTVAEILLSLRADMHREQVQSMEEWEEQERTIAWLRGADFSTVETYDAGEVYPAKDVDAHLASSPPEGRKPLSELDKAARNETEFAKPFKLPK